jgi:hypothetical protein
MGMEQYCSFTYASQVHREVPLSRAIEWRDALGDLEEVFDERNSQFAAPESLRQLMPSNESPYNPKEQRLWNEKCLGPRVGNGTRALSPLLDMSGLLSSAIAISSHYLLFILGSVTDNIART